MHRLFEKFVLEYFKRHHTYLTEARAAQVKWNLSPETEQGMIRFLPVMQTDVFLRYREKILIIDTKYYGHTMQRRYEKATLHSDNMYQIFTYVKNQDAAGTGNVSGMLLYARTEEADSSENKKIFTIWDSAEIIPGLRMHFHDSGDSGDRGVEAGHADCRPCFI